MQQVHFQDLGIIDYQKAWDYQEELFQELVNVKVHNRNIPEVEHLPQHHHLLFCEHPHVYTLGKSGAEGNLLINETLLKAKGATFHKINRGGDITYHGPGQLVGYPILDLDFFFTDIHKYLRYLEDVIILTMAHYGLKGERYPKYTGVWMDVENPAKARKICAMGVRCSRWVTMHGFAFNVNPDLSFFQNIVPCGISDKQVTSLERELGHRVEMEEVKTIVKEHLSALFGMELRG